jgi:hypothetical protein
MDSTSLSFSVLAALARSRREQDAIPDQIVHWNVIILRNMSLGVAFHDFNARMQSRKQRLSWWKIFLS